MKVCRKFLKNYDIPDPEEFCRSSWFSNRFTQGAYSFRQMESEINNVWASDLALPILCQSGSPVRKLTVFDLAFFATFFLNLALEN